MQMSLELFGNRIHATRMPGVAAPDAPQRQPTAPDHAKAFNGCAGIMGTTGSEPAVVSQPGTHQVAVGFNQSLNQFAHGLLFYASGFPVRQIIVDSTVWMHLVLPVQQHPSPPARVGGIESFPLSTA